MKLCKDCKYADMAEKKNTFCNHPEAPDDRRVSMMTGEVDYGIEATCLYMRRPGGLCGPGAHYFKLDLSPVRVEILYTCRGGMHSFRATGWPGEPASHMSVNSDDVRSAYRQVAKGLNGAFEAQYDVPADFRPDTSFEVFWNWFDKVSGPSKESGMTLACILTWRFDPE